MFDSFMGFSLNDSLHKNKTSDPTSDSSSTTKPTASSHYIHDHFNLPIEYLSSEDKHELSSIVAQDLELCSETASCTMYQHLFDPSEHGFAEEVMPKFQHYFSSNIEFLEDTQEVIENCNPEICNYDKENEVSSETIRECWKHVKHDPDFLEKYGYLDWTILQEYNKNSIVLQSICLANMLSPLSSFIVPFMFLLFPFVILKIQGVPISFEIYFSVLQNIAQHHFIGKAISGLRTMQFDKLIYVVAMFGLYIFQLYQNVVNCIRFYNNIERVNKELCTWKLYVTQSIVKLKGFLKKNEGIRTYKPFCSNIRYHLECLEEINVLLEPICSFECSLYKITEIGYMLRCYYELHDCPEYEQSICYSMGFNGYMDLMEGIHKNIKNHLIHYGQFKEPEPEPENSDDAQSETKEKSDSSGEDDIDTVVVKEPTEFITNQYYPTLKHDVNVVKNNANLDSHNVITGPNASGKTTFLKTTALNIIFTQQLGVGFYDSCCLIPYKHMHSYLNIPDTSGRDSLFQAESRRCKEILDSINHTPDEHHFCIFDELYSGTNPDEATKAAYAFMKYISAKPNVKLLLTTHYVSICDKWKKDKIDNYQMEVIHDDSKNNFDYTYKIKPGVSKVHGAIHILEQMNYPQSIIDSVKG